MSQADSLTIIIFDRFPGQSLYHGRDDGDDDSDRWSVMFVRKQTSWLTG